MRNFMLAVAAVAALLAVPVPSYSQSRGECRELWLACKMKDGLGERGQGNCRRWRQTCLAPSSPWAGPTLPCRDLRLACINKYELGEGGQGNCRRYRETCTGGAVF